MSKNWLLVIFSALVLSVQSLCAQDKTGQLDSFFTAAYKKGAFNGNVLIAEGGKIIYQHSFGMAEEATKRPLNRESVFELASVSKQFTAMGIMLLQQQGKLSFNDSLRKFFPELPYTNITVRQLLNHTSGLPDYMALFGEEWKDTTKIATNKDMIVLLAAHKPAVRFAPGTKYEYSNTGYALLASIIAKASGKSYGDYLAANIFKPLDMKRTEVFSRRYEKRAIGNYAFGYVRTPDGMSYALPDSVPDYAAYVYCLDGIQGDGTVNSTTGDLLKWDRALYTEKLVSKKLIDEAFSPVVLSGGDSSTYGFGWAVGRLAGIGKIVNHSGGWPGYATFIERHIDTDKTIIMLTNHDGPLPAMKSVRNILYGIKEVKPVAVQMDTAIYHQYAGTYELAPGFDLVFTAENGKLMTQATGQSKFEMFPEKEDLFFLKVVEAKVKFVRDEKGEVISLVLYQNGQEVPGKRKK